jgi:hypothetical protein
MITLMICGLLLATALCWLEKLPRGEAWIAVYVLCTIGPAIGYFLGAADQREDIKISCAQRQVMILNPTVYACVKLPGQE